MASNKWNEQYLNHADYAFFKSKYDSDTYISPEKKKNYETIIQHLKDESYDTIKFKNLLELLMKYLNSGHVMYNCRSDKCCRYINYSIAKKFREINYVQYTESKFNIFKKFMEGYYKTTGFRDCKDRLDFINPLILSRMDILYDLYDKYNYLISFKRADQHEKLCAALSLVLMSYKEAIKLHEENVNFISQLEQVRDLILSKSSNYNNTCHRNLSDITLPKPVTSHQDEMQEKQLNSHVPTQSAHNELENRRTMVSASDKSELSEQSGLQSQSIQSTEVQPPPVKPLPAHPHTAHLLSIQPQQDHSEPTHSHTVQLKREEAEAEDLHGVQFPIIEYSQKEWQTPEFMKPIDERTYTSEYSNKVLEYTDGLLGKMQGFITETLGQVEPAPILGVSGGMGALFLLFKYTPVGTFFGGRKRRNHLIPSGFPVAYPGFPGYEEQYGANFGPGPINISYQAE
ncbi:hypothetical protein, conserved [Plasmodium vivax]|uniref:VIR protein n=1 Tax=Plasmodium vivax TaxID=5855 RepID=A0A1G4E9Q4_PLAVI|nr:hypothetical protein, conserved [Plasmodium vivax]